MTIFLCVCALLALVGVFSLGILCGEEFKSREITRLIFFYERVKGGESNLVADCQNFIIRLKAKILYEERIASGRYDV